MEQEDLIDLREQRESCRIIIAVLAILANYVLSTALSGNEGWGWPCQERPPT